MDNNNIYEGIIVSHDIKTNTVDVYIGSLPEIDGDISNGLDLEKFLREEIGSRDDVTGEILYNLPLTYTGIMTYLEPKHIGNNGKNLKLHYALIITKVPGDPKQGIVFPQFRRFYPTKSVKVNSVLNSFGKVI